MIKLIRRDSVIPCTCISHHSASTPWNLAGIDEMSDTGVFFPVALMHYMGTATVIHHQFVVIQCQPSARANV